MPCETAYEELSAWEAGDLEGERSDAVAAHVEQCAECRSRLEGLRRVNQTLLAMPPERPSAHALLETRRALAAVLRPPAAPREILTLEEVAELLRVSPDALDEIVDELPAFELGGQVRVRRDALVEWIKEREKSWRRASVESQISEIMSGF